MAVHQTRRDAGHQLISGLQAKARFFTFPEAFREETGMWGRWCAFLNDESGATSIEYALIASGVALVIITVVKGVGTRLHTTFSSISTQLK